MPICFGQCEEVLTQNEDAGVEKTIKPGEQRLRSSCSLRIKEPGGGAAQHRGGDGNKRHLLRGREQREDCGVGAILEVGPACQRGLDEGRELGGSGGHE